MDFFFTAEVVQGQFSATLKSFIKFNNEISDAKRTVILSLFYFYVFCSLCNMNQLTNWITQHYSEWKFQDPTSISFVDHSIYISFHFICSYNAVEFVHNSKFAPTAYTAGRLIQNSTPDTLFDTLLSSQQCLQLQNTLQQIWHTHVYNSEGQQHSVLHIASSPEMTSRYKRTVTSPNFPRCFIPTAWGNIIGPKSMTLDFQRTHVLWHVPPLPTCSYEFRILNHNWLSAVRMCSFV